jgi:hypothetical protein
LPEKEAAAEEEEDVVVRTVVNREVVVVRMLVNPEVVVIPAPDLPRAAVSRPDRNEPVNRVIERQPLPRQENPAPPGPSRIGRSLHREPGRIEPKIARMAKGIGIGIGIGIGMNPRRAQKICTGLVSRIITTTMAVMAVTTTTTTGITVILQPY